jgi:hypothetical protein
MFIRVKVSFSENVNISLQLSDLVKISDESLADLFHQERLISNIELYDLLLLIPLSFLLSHLLLSSPYAECLSLLQLSLSTHQGW